MAKGNGPLGRGRKPLLPVGTKVIRYCGAGSRSKVYTVIGDYSEDVLLQCPQERWPQQISKWHILTSKMYSVQPVDSPEGEVNA